MTITFEATHFDGTVYKKVVQRFQFAMESDDNDSFETADEIALGSHKAPIDLDHGPIDYYKVWLEQGQIVQVELLLPPYLRHGDPEQEPPWYYDVGLNLWVYDPNRELAARSVRGENRTSQITLTVDSTDWWFIKIEAVSGERLYELHIKSLEGSS